MSDSVFNSKALQDEAAAYRWVEAEVWPDGPICPHYGSVERIGNMKHSRARSSSSGSCRPLESLASMTAWRTSPGSSGRLRLQRQRPIEKN